MENDEKMEWFKFDQGKSGRFWDEQVIKNSTSELYSTWKFVKIRPHKKTKISMKFDPN